MLLISPPLVFPMIPAKIEKNTIGRAKTSKDAIRSRRSALNLHLRTDRIIPANPFLSVSGRLPAMKALPPATPPS